MLIQEASPYAQLRDVLGGNWPSLEKARLKAQEIKLSIEDKINSIYSNDDASLIVFGSLAREEFTPHSDIDWTILVDGRVDINHKELQKEVSKIICIHEGKPPGAEGNFGGISYSHDLVHKIGGNEDTNINTTQRILLLLESCSLGNDSAYSRVKREILSRYIKEDWGIRNSEYKIPRFLLNDIARYWRTMCVDFAYKRKNRDKGWAIRTIKLRLSRKLIFVSGLLSCYSCTEDETLQRQLSKSRISEASQSHIINHLIKITALTPIDIVAKMILPYSDLYISVKKIFSAYDKFISILDNEDYRKHLENLAANKTDSDKLYNEARVLGHQFQEGLNDIFFGSNSSNYLKLTRNYGVF